VKAPRCLDRRLNRFGAGIGEEHAVGEGCGHQARAEFVLPGDLEDVETCQSFSACASSRHEVRMGVAEHVHGIPPMKSR
jgi:hypothetical protein